QGRVAFHAVRLANAGDIDGAIALIQADMAKCGQTANNFINLAVFHAMKGQCQEALELLDRAEDLGGISSHPYLLTLNRAVSLRKIGRPSEAAALLWELREQRPEDFLVLCNLANVLIDLDRLDSAAVYYRKLEGLRAKTWVVDRETRQQYDKM